MLEQFIQKYEIGLVEYAVFAVLFLFIILLLDQIIHFKPKVKESVQMQLDLDQSELKFDVMPRHKNHT